MTENETSFLAFPPVPESTVLVGAGDGREALARRSWSNDCTLHYWGDIDTHGFAILAQLRGHFAHVHAFLMDRQALDAHRAVRGREATPVMPDLHRLTADEWTLYDALRDHRIRTGLRLEQEQIGFDMARLHLQACSAMPMPVARAGADLRLNGMAARLPGAMREVHATMPREKQIFKLVRETNP